MTQAPQSIPQTLQDLPPKWAHFCLHAERFIKDDLGVDLIGKTVVSALSGGVDSSALLLVLHYLSRKNGGRIVAVHLNHQLRPEADEDALWIENVCAQLSVKCIMESEDVAARARKNDTGLEEAGREARYELFNTAMADHGGDYLAVGHHLDDLCEDVLMRMMRGTGWPGLSGMPGYDADRKLIRPFLLTPKAKLIEFLTDIGLSWREDETNADDAMTRNRVRNTILPLFLEENPSFPESVARLWKVGRIDEDFWKQEVEGVTNPIPNDVLEKHHQAVRLRLYKAVLDAYGPGQALADTLFKLDKAWVEKRIGSTFQFPGDKIATITASSVVFSLKD